MIALTAHMTAKEGKEADLERVLGALAEKVLANESGCKMYQLTRSKADPRSYLVIERYEDDAALAYHSNTDHFKAAIPEIMACLEAPPQIALFEELE